MLAITRFMVMDEKQKKRATQEANQKASQISKSGLKFYCCELVECQGDLSLLKQSLETMNKIVTDKNGRVVRNISSVCKLLLSINDDQLVMVTYVSEGETRITAKEWLSDAIGSNGIVTDNDDDATATGIIVNDPNKCVYVFKLRDAIIATEYAKLRARGFIPQDKDEDDDLYDDDVFLSIM